MVATRRCTIDTRTTLTHEEVATAIGVPLPGWNELPPGPTRDLTEALHELYRAAGTPGLRTIAVAVTDDNRFRDTVSHQKVAAMLRGTGVPKWSKLQPVVLILAEWSTPQRNRSKELQRFKQLWDTAAGREIDKQPQPAPKLNGPEGPIVIDRITEPMTITVLGCSGSVPGPGTPASGYLLEADGFLLAMELGSGTFAALQAIHDPFDIDALLISHLHPDHCADISPLTVFRRYHPAPPNDPTKSRLPIYAPSDASSRFAAAYATDRQELEYTDLSDVYMFHMLEAGGITIGPFQVTVILAAHPCEAYSFRVSHGNRSLVFTGDTEMTEWLVELATESNTLLAEACCTHQDAGHWLTSDLSGKQAGELAKRAKVGRLLLTHVPPWVDAATVLTEASAEFPGHTVLVEPGKTYAV